jgi:hypothetical protein
MSKIVNSTVSASLSERGSERDVKFWTDRMSVIEQRIELFRTRLREESKLLKLERRETAALDATKAKLYRVQSVNSRSGLWSRAMETAFRHVVDGRRIVAHQRERVEMLTRHGHDTTKARTLDLFARARHFRG